MPATMKLRTILNFSFLFLVLLLESTGGLDLGYNVIEQTGKFCPGRDSCRTGGRGSRIGSSRGPEGVENDWKKRNCFCDNACSVYGDCCIDANAYVQDQQKVNHLSFECANLKQYGDIYMRNKCPDDWYDSRKIQEACENPGPFTQDPFGSTPVTSIPSGFTYKNYFCSVCNRDSTNVRFWRPRLECPTLTSYNNRFKNLTKNFIEDNLFLSEHDDRWGVNIDTSGVTVFHECTVDPAVPDTLTHLVRSCSGKSTVSTCPLNYDQNQTIVELCSSYTAMVFEPNAAYRNVHCAICNNASLDKLICLNLGPFGRFNWQQNFNSFSFAVLFDISGDIDDKVGFVKCNDGELFDPFFKKCRNVICGQDGMEYRNGRCLDTRIPPVHNWNEGYTPSPPSPATVVTPAIEIFPETTTRRREYDSKATQSTTARFAFTTTTLSTKPSTKSSSTISTTSKSSENSHNVILLESNTENETEIIHSNTGHGEPSTASVTKLSTLVSTTSTTKSTTVSEELSTTTIKPSSISSTNKPTPSSTESNEETTIKNTETIEEFIDEFNDCPKFELQIGEYKMMEDEEKHSVYVEKYDRVLEEGEFSMNGDNLVICVTASDANKQIAKFGPQMGYVTFVCLGISIICLSLHIIASFVTSELQNLSGKNLVSLCFALLGGYVTFIAGMFQQGHQGLSCKVLAVAMYFFYMSSFFWMMIIAFDVCKTLKMATTQLRLTTGSQWRKFSLYSTVAWGLPVAFVTVVAILDHVEAMPEAYKPGFGVTELCWFSNKMALLVYFAVPFAGVMGLNIFLFVLSACMVYDTTKATSKMTTCGPRTNFHLYLRLAVIMGLTWVTGLAAGFVDLEPVWYVFVGLNTLQGLFIFVAFTCNKKVITGVRETLTGSRTHSLTDGRGAHWRLSRDSSLTNATKKSHLDLSPTPTVNLVSAGPNLVSSGPTGTSLPAESVPSRYGPRSKTMYTVSKQQVSGVTQNSFNGRYY